MGKGRNQNSQATKTAAEGVYLFTEDLGLSAGVKHLQRVQLDQHVLKRLLHREDHHLQQKVHIMFTSEMVEKTRPFYKYENLILFTNNTELFCPFFLEK